MPVAANVNVMSVIHACGRKCECDVRDSIAEGATYVKGACMEVCVPAT